MTYLQFLLVVHVLGAVIGFGSTFAFAFFPQDADRLEPGVRTTLADISYKVSRSCPTRSCSSSSRSPAC